MTPFNFVNSITYTKQNLLEVDPENIKHYVPFIINKALSYYADTVFFANELNKYSFLPSDMQYAFYINTIRKQKRFSPWHKKENNEDIEAVQKFFNLSYPKASDVLQLLSAEQITTIKQQLGEYNE